MRFEFGKNWTSFSSDCLDEKSLEKAHKDFDRLFSGIRLKGKKFLDIGFGQGLSLLLAQKAGAEANGIDVDEDNLKAFSNTALFFKDVQKPDVSIRSILDDNYVSLELEGSYDIVHSWGVLHHTGDMSKAIYNSARLVRKNGFLVISIYNRHWSSAVWLMIKWIYNFAPREIRRMMVFFAYPIIYLAKFIVTFDNPIKMHRGMDFYHDVIDWVGGYPYEFASPDEITQKMRGLGFELVRFIPSQVPTGCNEYIYKKNRYS